MRTGNNRGWIPIVIIITVLILLSAILRIYVDWLWFKSILFNNVFVVTLVNRWGLGILVFLFACLFIYINLMLTRRYRQNDDFTEDGREIIYAEPPSWANIIKSQAAGWFFFITAAFIAFIIASIAADNWLIVQQYLHAVSFGFKDPIFSRDLSFYIFDLRFFKYIYGIIMPTLVVTMVLIVLVYSLTAALDFFSTNWRDFNWPKAHVAVLLSLILLLKAWGYNLATYGILYSSRGAVFGAGYTDIHARLFAYKVLLVVTVIVALIILVNLFIRRLSWIAVGLAGWLAVSILLNGLYPGIVQKFSVEPNEFNREKPYIQNNIKFTRMAYGLDRVQTNPFNVSYNLTRSNLKENQATVQNIRLWDWQPLKQTYKAIQEIRPYYNFSDIDIDRYVINGQYRQVMLGVRELSQDKLPANAKTWVNTKLKYTHGYGIAMSPVNEIAQEGLPVLFVKNIPPVSTIDLKVGTPQIYFGEQTNSYVIVDTRTKEFDYPMGKQNAETTYHGKNGVKVGTLGRRMVLAWVLKDYKMLLSSDVTPQSQILLYRNIVERVNKVAPFLEYDGDPYAVIVSGKTYWVIDAYTTSSLYPYSEPSTRGYNYIRNSVKVVIDAYDGSMDFYLADPTDPVAQSYSRIFKGMFHPLQELPTGLRSHLRYPEDLFKTQTEMYALYHMTDPQVFYNKEDKWSIPQEIFGSNLQREQLQAYYMIMKLPGETEPEYVLMLPFTPSTKENMISWFCARCDGENYGKLKVYDFSKQELIFGPMQVESRINQNSEISQLLTLWNQQGSRVFRGNLLVIPINQSILYIEPVYLQAEQSKIPELRRIIAIYNDKVAMEPNLGDALTRLFSNEEPATVVVPPGGESVKDLAESADLYFKRAQSAIQAGDWSGYGENMKKVEEILKQLVDASQKAVE